MAKKNYYLILGIPRTESQSGVREAFRALAKRYHPERIGERGARFFQEILQAYQVLSDPEKRRHYDQGLSHAEGTQVIPGATVIAEVGGRTPTTLPQPVSFLRDFETVSPPYEQMRAQVVRNFTRSGSTHEEPSRSFNVQLILSPEQALRGGMARITIPVFYPCPTCGGSGQDWLFSCASCQAQGMLEEEETMRLPIPPMVQDYTLIETPVRGLGLHNMNVRLYIRVA